MSESEHPATPGRGELREELQTFLSESRDLYIRREEIVDMQRQDPDSVTSDLLNEKHQIEEQLYQSGQSLWDAFCKWGGELGYEPITISRDNTPGPGREG